MHEQKILILKKEDINECLNKMKSMSLKDLMKIVIHIFDQLNS